MSESPKKNKKQKVGENIPKEDLKKLIDISFNYERRKFIFWTFNSSYLGIAIFQLFSDINIEGGSNPDLCLDAQFENANHDPIDCPTWLYHLIVALIIAHLTQVFAGMIGFYGIDQKSRKINKGYQILLLFSCMYDVIMSIVVSSTYSQWDGTPYENTANEFLMLLIIFIPIQLIITYFSLNQFRKASHENFAVQNEKEHLLEKYNEMVIDVAKQFVIN